MHEDLGRRIIGLQEHYENALKRARVRELALMRRLQRKTDKVCFDQG